jgi:DNA-binding MarR family transcriptional regulator
MVKHLPEWMMRRYSKLWLKFKEKSFTREQAEKILPKDSSLGVLLSELKKSGWLEMTMSEEDGRKTVYQLKTPNKTFLSLVKDLGR